MTDGTPRTFTWPPKTIVAAVDFGEASARAITLAGVVAAGGTATLRVLHAERFDVPPYFTPAQIDRLEDERTEATAEITTELTRFAKSSTTWPTTVVVADGRPLDVILEQSADADLLVLGTHGRRGPSRWWLGSVAERVVRAADVPVLVTRADATPAADLFARVVVIGDDTAPDQPTRMRVEALASAQGGHIVASDTLAACGTDTVTTATLVAVAVPRGRSGWALSDVVTDALGHCAHPVLFIPAA
jgi:nucleotide-binding universal stress UspA family protein